MNQGREEGRRREKRRGEGEEEGIVMYEEMQTAIISGTSKF